MAATTPLRVIPVPRLPSPGMVASLAVACWGRRYEFADSPFPCAVESAGQALLSVPIRIAARVDGRTRIVAVSWVAFHNGFVYPIDEIGRLCRERGILFVVDAIQGLGALPLDVGKSPIDVLVADAHKWLLGPEACAIFYVAQSARDRLPPPFGGWWNVKGAAGGSGYLDYGLDFHAGGRAYEAGSLPTAQIMGLAAALEAHGIPGEDARRR